MTTNWERLTDAQREAVCAAVAEALGDAMDCHRVWSAWRHGIMDERDFSPVSDDPNRVAEIAAAAINAVAGAEAEISPLQRE